MLHNPVIGFHGKWTCLGWFGGHLGATFSHLQFWARSFMFINKATSDTGHGCFCNGYFECENPGEMVGVVASFGWLTCDVLRALNHLGAH